MASRAADAYHRAMSSLSRKAGCRRVLCVLLSLLIGTCVWLPLLHVFFRPKPSDYYAESGLSPKAQALLRRHMDLWSDPDLRAHEVERMRTSNAEWDFMARTFLVLSLANAALRNADGKAEYLRVIDVIIDETLRLEEEHGVYYFLMDYARDSPFVSAAGRSLFEDGEIALMLACRGLVEEKDAYRAPLSHRVDLMVETMQESPVLSGESYPNECWTFCNAVALAAIRLSDVLEGTDHSAFLHGWIETARERLVDEQTGLLFSSYSFTGVPYDGPEGSTIWMVAHCLQVVDPAFAKDQYDRARKELGNSVLGFGYAREWPEERDTPGQYYPRGWLPDVDSGPIIPFLKISAGSSGMALLGASAFDDREYFSSLLTSLAFGGFPVEKNGRLKYCASNAVGDAVILYAAVVGPLWEEAARRSAPEAEEEEGPNEE